MGDHCYATHAMDRRDRLRERAEGAHGRIYPEREQVAAEGSDLDARDELEAIAAAGMQVARQ
jgi:hypothetical protein